MTGENHMTERKVKQKTERSPEELKALYVAKVEHQVANVDKWLGKLAKSCHHRKYDLGDDVRDRITDHITAKTAAAAKKIAGVPEEVERFKLIE